MFVHNIDPVIFSIGPLSIRYYGVIYALGFILAYIFLKNASKRKELPIEDDDVDALIIYLMIGVVVGARIFEILFYNPSYYFSKLLNQLLRPVLQSLQNMWAFYVGVAGEVGDCAGEFNYSVVRARRKVQPCSRGLQVRF